SWTPPGPLTPGHHYQWRVQGFDSLGNSSSKSAAFRFRIDPLSKPRLIGPMGTSAGITPTFSWNAVPGADHYQIAVFSISGRTSLIETNADVSGTEFTLPFILKPLDRYRWCVRAIAPNGSFGPWSNFAIFTT